MRMWVKKVLGLAKAFTITPIFAETPENSSGPASPGPG